MDRRDFVKTSFAGLVPCFLWKKDQIKHVPEIQREHPQKISRSDGVFIEIDGKDVSDDCQSMECALEQDAIDITQWGHRQRTFIPGMQHLTLQLALLHELEIDPYKNVDITFRRLNRKTEVDNPEFLAKFLLVNANIFAERGSLEVWKYKFCSTGKIKRSI